VRVNPERIVADALERRAELLCAADTTAYRLIHGASDGAPGFYVDRFGPVLIAQFHVGRLTVSEEHCREIATALLAATGAQAVYRKTYPKDRSFDNRALDAAHHDPTPWIGTATADEVEATELGLRFGVRPYDGYLSGWFCEQRFQRNTVRSLSAGKRVLNLFAYTCGFSVAAALGGASFVASVDLAKRALERGRAKFARNGLSVEGHRFYARDVFDYFRQAERHDERFDLVIVDPPTFARGSGRAFKLPDDWPRLLEACVRRLAPGGRLLACTNHRETSAPRFEQLLRNAGAARGLRVQPAPPAAIDCPADADFAKARWLA
jgi:23S rRNA (cytosine1962-C5)-methyltransferase